MGLAVRQLHLGYARVYPKASGLSYNEINNNKETVVEKKHKGLWRQNSLD